MITRFTCSQRRFMQAVGANGAALPLAAGLVLPAQAAVVEPSMLSVDPSPRFRLSPYLYMQFMKPLGTTDASVSVVELDLKPSV